MAFRNTPAGAYAVLIAHPEWKARQAASELGVSTGTISNWRKRIGRDEPTRPPGRPRVAPGNRERERFDRRVYLALNDPREGLVRVIRRLAHRRRPLSPEERTELRVDLYQTSYTVVRDEKGNVWPLETNGDAIVKKALGKKKARAFLKTFRALFPAAKKRAMKSEEPFRSEAFKEGLPVRSKARRKCEE